MIPKQSHFHYERSPVLSEAVLSPVAVLDKSPAQGKSPRWPKNDVTEKREEFRGKGAMELPAKASFSSFASSPRNQSFDDYSNLDSAYNSAFSSAYGSTLSCAYGSTLSSIYGSTLSSAFGSTGSGLGSLNDVEVMVSPNSYKFGEQRHGKFPSWPVAEPNGRQAPNSQFSTSRSTSWSGQGSECKKDARYCSRVSFSAVAGDKDVETGRDLIGRRDNRVDDSRHVYATHREETFSPESARRIFREAAARKGRCDRPHSERYSGSWLPLTPEKPRKVFLQPSPSKEVETGRISGRSLSSVNIAACGLQSRSPESPSHRTGTNFTSGMSGVIGKDRPSFNVISGNDRLNRSAADQSCVRDPSANIAMGVVNSSEQLKSNGPELGQAVVSLRNNWNHLRPTHLPVVTFHGVTIVDSSKNRPIDTNQSNVNIRTNVTAGKNCSDGSGETPSNAVVTEQIGALSVSQTLILRKLSQELYGQSGLMNHTIVEGKAFRRSTDESCNGVAGGCAKSSLSYHTPQNLGRGSQEDLSGRPCENGCTATPRRQELNGRGVTFDELSYANHMLQLARGLENNDGGINCSFQLDQASGLHSTQRKHLQYLQSSKSFEETVPFGLPDGQDKSPALADSPTPPELPARNYRIEELGEKQNGATLEGHCGTSAFNCDFDSPAMANTYTEQLRKEAKRLSHPHGSASGHHSSRVDEDNTGCLLDLKNSGKVSRFQCSFGQESPLNPVEKTFNIANDRKVIHFSDEFDISHLPQSERKTKSNNPGLISDKEDQRMGTGANMRSPSRKQVVKPGAKDLGTIDLKEWDKVSSGESSVFTMQEFLYSGSNTVKFVCIPVTENTGLVQDKTSDVSVVSSVSKISENNKAENFAAFTSAANKMRRKSVNLNPVLINEAENVADVRSNNKDLEERKSLSQEAQSLGKERCGVVKNCTNKERTNSSAERKNPEKKCGNSDEEHLNIEINNSSLKAKCYNIEITSPGKELKGVRHGSSDHKVNCLIAESNSVDSKFSFPERSLSENINASDQNRKSSGQSKDHKDHERGCSENEGKKLLDENHCLNQRKERKETHVVKNGASTANHDKKIDGKPSKCDNHKSRRQCFEVSDCSSKDKVSKPVQLIKELSLFLSSKKNDSVPQTGTVLDCKNPGSDSHEKRLKTNPVCEQVIHGSGQALGNILADGEIGKTVKEKSVAECDESKVTCKHDEKTKMRGFTAAETEQISNCYVKNESSAVLASGTKLFNSIPEEYSAVCNKTKAVKLVSGNHGPGKSLLTKEERIKLVKGTSEDEVKVEAAEVIKVNTSPDLMKVPSGNTMFENNVKVNLTKPKQISFVLDKVTKIENASENHSAAEPKDVKQSYAIANVKMTNVKHVDSASSDNSLASKKTRLATLESVPVNEFTAKEDTMTSVSPEGVMASTGSHCGSGDKPLDVAMEAIVDRFMRELVSSDLKTATHYMTEFIDMDNFTVITIYGNISQRSALCKSLRPFVRHLARNMGSSTKEIASTDDESFLREIEEKLKDFEQERQSIDKESTECADLGHEVMLLAEQKLGEKEFGKYKLYIDELEKIHCLLLNLTKRLASIENSLGSLPKDACSEERSELVFKRDELSQKFEDAKVLSEGITHRRHLVVNCLMTRLSNEELERFECFEGLKVRLFLEKQAVDDIITLLRRQLPLKENFGQ